jgi:AbrB family looped-hinge helix DNA binding protein
MGKVTSKLQVTVPKAIADRFRIKPGDEIVWTAAGDSIRVAPRKAAARSRSVEARQRLFDEATSRQKKRNKNVKAATGDRGWTRENLYDRGRAR